MLCGILPFFFLQDHRLPFCTVDKQWVEYDTKICSLSWGSLRSVASGLAPEIALAPKS
jgi:hypothetical protein